MNSARAWAVWGVATLAYTLAVLNRTSLGVAAPDAIERFHVSAAAISTLAVAQLAVYAAMQIPVGVLLDRFGPKLLIVIGAATMAVGQLTVALSDDVVVAVIGRMLVGAGDAATFLSMIRLTASWFTGRSLALLTQLSGIVGSTGQLISTLPFLALLDGTSWGFAFGTLAVVTAIGWLLSMLVLRNEPRGSAPLTTGNIDLAPGWWGRLVQAARQPGTQLAFWTHFTTQSTPGVFMLLWGYPYLTEGIGLPRSEAGWILTFAVIVGIAIGPMFGAVIARFPMRRSHLVLGLVAAICLSWIVLVSYPGVPPLPVVITCVSVISLGLPGSLIAFDMARSFNPLRIMGSASGIVNVGGFTACFTMMGLVGLILDLVHHANLAAGIPSELYSLDGFRIAFASQIPIVLVGVVFLLIARARTRRKMEAEGQDVKRLRESLALWLRSRRQK